MRVYKTDNVFVCLFVCFLHSSSGTLNVTIPSGCAAMMKKSDCFRMAMWLAICNEFYLKKVHTSLYASNTKYTHSMNSESPFPSSCRRTHQH